MRVLAGVVGGIRPLCLHGGDDVLVGGQLGGAPVEVALPDRKLVTADDLVVAWHVERRRVHSPAEGVGKHIFTLSEYKPKKTILLHT